MTWWGTAPTFLLSLLVFFAPGLLVLAAGGVRRLNLVALASPVSTTISGVSAVLFKFVNVPFNPVTYFGLSIVLAVIVFALKYFLGRKFSPDSSHAFMIGANGPLTPHDTGRMVARVALPVAILVPALIIAYRYMSGFGTPDSFSQTFDNIYHLNAIRFIADTHNGSTLSIGNLTPSSSGLYPAAMHDSVAIVLMMGAPTVMTALNVSSIVIGALVWPLACIFMITRIVGYRPIPVLAAGVFAAGFSGFPYLMVAFGVLYPNHAALAILPAAMGLAVEALGLSRTPPRSQLAAVLVFLMVFPGLALSHPSAAVALLGFAAPVVLARAIRQRAAVRAGHASKRSGIWWWVATAAYALFLVVVWRVARPSLTAAGWTPFQTNARAIGEVLSSAPMGTTVAWVMLLLTVIGLFVVGRRFRTHWWIGGIFAVGGALYIIVSSWSNGWFRTFVTGVWYTDSYRLAALLPVVTLPIVVIGAQWLQWRVRSLIERGPRPAVDTDSRTRRILTSAAQRLPHGTGLAVSVVMVIVLGFGSQGGTLANVQTRLATIYTTTKVASLLSQDEVALLNQVAPLVPPDDVIVDNPRTGSSLVYAFANRKALAPHIFGVRTAEEQFLLDHWDEAAYNPAVCPLVKKLHAYYALDFGNTEITPRAQPLVGVRDLTDGTAPGMQIIKAVGQARLVKVTACGQG